MMASCVPGGTAIRLTTRVQPLPTVWSRGRACRGLSVRSWSPRKSMIRPGRRRAARRAGCRSGRTQRPRTIASALRPSTPKAAAQPRRPARLGRLEPEEVRADRRRPRRSRASRGLYQPSGMPSLLASVSKSSSAGGPGRSISASWATAGRIASPHEPSHQRSDQVPPIATPTRPASSRRLLGVCPTPRLERLRPIPAIDLAGASGILRRTPSRTHRPRPWRRRPRAGPGRSSGRTASA